MSSSQMKVGGSNAKPLTHLAIPHLMFKFFGGQGDTEPNALWEAGEIRFDVSAKELECRPGEVVLDNLDPVEDTKGNNGDQGQLRITNLRISWHSLKNSKVNISIGFNCVTAINVKDAESRLKGKTQAIYVLTKHLNQRFEFVFSVLQKSTSAAFQTLLGVFKAFDQSRLYRDLKLRGSLIQDKELKLLPMERTYSKVNGVWNLSSEQGNLGTFFISDVRVVWYANLAESFNVSIPYLQIKSVKVRESKFGLALVLETTSHSGGYVLGFKIDPKETLDYCFKEINSLWSVYSKTPIFGVDYKPNPEQKPLSSYKVTDAEDDVQITDTGDRGDLLATYYADATKGTDREPVYNSELGLSIEQLKDGLTVESLWSVV